MNDIAQYNISIILDNRRVKSKGTFPVKLRVYSKATQTKKLYSLDIDMTPKAFETVRGAGNVKGKNKELRLFLNRYEGRANSEAEKLNVFSFEAFENKLLRKRKEAIDLNYHYNKLIQDNIDKERIGTADSFKYSLKSLNNFHNKTSSLTFYDITVSWLESYEKYMLAQGKSITSTGFYLRALRTVFNNAIHLNDIHEDIYPFGKRKYQIPSSKKVKKALTSDELIVLFESTPDNEEQAKAKDFWFFSYACSGMNLKDIALLKYSDIKDGKFSYYRSKTFSKSLEKSKIEIFINNFSQGIISKYGTNDLNSYVFSIVDIDDSAMTSYRKIKNFTRYVNQHIKKLAKNNDITPDISFYWSRHSFATNSIRKGASMEFISNALNHSDMNVTKDYFSGFEDKAKKEFSDKLMDF